MPLPAVTTTDRVTSDSLSTDVSEGSTATMTATRQTLNLIAVGVAVPLAIVVLAIVLAAIAAAAVLVACRHGHKQGSRDFHNQELVRSQTSGNEHKIVVNCGLQQDVKEGWRSSIIEQQVELPVQKGVPVLEIVV